MHRNTDSPKRLAVSLLAGFLLFAWASSAGDDASRERAAATAWGTGEFKVDVAGVVRRSDIVLQRPNLRPEQAMPLGNGRLGISVWAEEGFTIQLNRADTLPGRLSPGQVIIPGLKTMAEAKDYQARLDLYDGEFSENGGGMSASVYVQPGSDIAVINVSGADPNTVQTAKLYLWSPRTPESHVGNQVAALSETWKDDKESGSSGKRFGSLSAITARARDVHAEAIGSLAVQLAFKPEPDGSFQILVAAPEWAGGGAVHAATAILPAGLRVSPAEHRAWWHKFWAHTGLFRLSSEDKSAEYMENLRAIDLYTAAAERGGAIPGEQAGIGDLFSSIRDAHQWGPSAYWHWNLRMQVAANIGAGAYSLNDSYFRLYRVNLHNVEAWTAQHMHDLPGVCVPETMRFNGPGFENESWLKGGAPLNCASDFKPYYNARTLSTGAEISLWIWQQYLATQDRAFLIENYPVMAASARFLLAYAQRGADSLLHTYPSNAHETQWDVHDPTTDIAAMKSLFPVVMRAAELCGKDSDLISQLKTALGEIRDFSRMDEQANIPVAAAEAAQPGHDVIAPSYDLDAPIHNTENVGLEPIWPYSLIGDAGPMHDLGVRTFAHRPNKEDDDWSFDPIQAARLGLPVEVKRTLLGLTEKYQAYPSGLAKFMGPEFYVEQIGVLTAALQDALVQDYDGLIRIAPAWPSDWDADAVVYIQKSSKVDVQIRHGVAVTVVLESGSSDNFSIRNPWPGRAVDVLLASNYSPITAANASAEVLQINAEAGKSYIIEPHDQPLSKLHFMPVIGSPASSPKLLGTRSIGLAATLPPSTQ